MLVLSAEEVRRALPMGEAIQAMKKAYACLSSGKAEVPLRTRLPVQPHDGLSLFMPAYVNAEAAEALAVKVVSLFPGNPARGLAYIQAAVLLLDATSGQTLALLEGSSLTAIRTGAGGGAATDLLARPESSIAAIFGAGAQGRTQLEATCTIRHIKTVFIYDPDRERAFAFADEMAGHGPIPGDLRVAQSPRAALAEADIICTATISTTPVFADQDLKAGAHVTAVGSYMPEMQEVPAETVKRARVVVDSRSATLAETGDLLQPMRAGIFAADHIYAELGEILLGQKPGRGSPEEITYFKSVGVAVQDAMAAQLAFQNAQKYGLGQEVQF